MRHLGWPGACALGAVILLACPGGDELHENAWLYVNRDPWVIDAVYVGTSRQESIYIENMGLQTLELSSVTLAGSGAFSRLPQRTNPADGGIITNPTSTSIEPRQRSYFALIFNPPREGMYNAQVTINSNAENAPTKVIDVSARADDAGT